MTAYHMYSDEEKIWRFRRVEMKLQYRRSEHQGTSVSEEFDVGRAFFASAPQGEHVPLHAASRRQILVVLDGEYEFTSTTGEVMRLEKGDLLFADDAEGL